MRLKREHLTLYAVTDRGSIGNRNFEQAIHFALAGGVTCLQLREKNMPEQELIAEAKRIKEICKEYNVPLILNDNYRAALEAGADGVHVGRDDTPVADIRRIAGKDFIIGATAKTIAQAQKAEADGADYIGVGAVFPSPTKPEAFRITHEILSSICHSVYIPAVAIGGITPDNVYELRGSGIAGIAVVSSLFGAEYIRTSAAHLKEIMGGML